MAACPQCGTESREGARFCDACGAQLATQPADSPVEERKVVSVLFCDLAGFTAASEAADPEEVRARLRPYHALLRERVEAFDGTVEKFVGDAVMAVFGAPVAHEDDAERAVRAGLAILEAIDGLNESDPSLQLAVRVGINTGEALVSLDARPEQGEGFVTGDVVNTASRIEGAAPVGGVAVGEGTYRVTEPVFEWGELPAVEVKGKAEPLALWQPLAARARLGSDVIRRLTTPLVGRELDVLQLRTVFEKAAREPSVQLVTIVGEPGVGKSRLVAELGAHVDSLPQLVRWRQGRCLPYGDGIAFWALGEIVKAQAGVYESDSPAEAERKLESVLPDVEERAWLKARLLPLLGIEAGPAPDRDESFTAWRRFLESIAEHEPAVLVFEDLHWADDALLDFLEHLAEWAQDVPLLVLGTARPELHERRPAWGAGSRNQTTIGLSPLSDDETARLITLLLEQAVLPVETQRAILERAGGNPLYAEEFVRMLRDSGLIDATGALPAEAEVPVPDSIQALIAARLDTLPAEVKALVQDAAVIGKVFWVGAVTAMGDRDRPAVERALHELARKELVRPSRQSAMEGEQEIGFWHALVRDVAYAQIPRAQRAAKHVAAARWIEDKAAERVEDLADVLAYHTGQAVELAEATGSAELAATMAPSARRFALLAGERALGLDTQRAVELFERAVALTPVDDPARPEAELRFAVAAHQSGRRTDAEEAIGRAVAGFELQGDPLRLARALTAFHLLSRRRLDGGSSIVLAIELLEQLPPGPELVAAYAQLAGSHVVRGENAACLAASGRALEVAREAGLPVPARALGFHGVALSLTGDPEGLAEQEEAIRLLVEAGDGRDAAVAMYNLAMQRWVLEGPAPGLEAVEGVIDFASRRGLVEMETSSRIGALGRLIDLGRLDDAVAVTRRLSEAVTLDHWELSQVEFYAGLARARRERGQEEAAHEAAGKALEQARAFGSPIALALAAVVLDADEIALAGDDRGARSLLNDVLRWEERPRNEEWAARLPAVARAVVASGDVDLAERLTEGVGDMPLPLHQHSAAAAGAVVLEGRGEHARAAQAYADAAARWDGFGARLEHAYALLGQGHCLAALGDSGAEQPLREARALFEEMGARPRVEECDSLLATVLARGA